MPGPAQASCGPKVVSRWRQDLPSLAEMNVPWSVPTAHCFGLPGLTAMSSAAAAAGAARASKVLPPSLETWTVRVVVAQRHDHVAVDLDVVVVGLAEARDGSHVSPPSADRTSPMFCGSVPPLECPDAISSSAPAKPDHEVGQRPGLPASAIDGLNSSGRVGAGGQPEGTGRRADQQRAVARVDGDGADLERRVDGGLGRRSSSEEEELPPHPARASVIRMRACLSQGVVVDSVNVSVLL